MILGLSIVFQAMHRGLQREPFSFCAEPVQMNRLRKTYVKVYVTFT